MVALDKVLIIANMTSGRCRAGIDAGLLSGELKDLGCVPEVLLSDCKDCTTKFFSENHGNTAGYTLLVILGGDGTVNFCLNEMRAHGWDDVPIYVMGRGSANDFASHYKTNRSVAEVVKVLKTGKVVDVDVLEATAHKDGVPFNKYAINVTGGGAFTTGVTNYSNKQKKVLGRLAYILRAVWEAIVMKPQQVEISYTDVEGVQQKITENIFLFFIVNCKHVGGMKNMAKNADPTDGVLDLVFIRKCGIFARAWMGLFTLSNKGGQNKRVITIPVLAATAKPLGSVNKNFTVTDIDGNPGGDYPLGVRLAGKVKVLVP